MSEIEPERPRDPRLIEIAERLADDAPVDWEEARQKTGDLSSTLERLREIQAVAERHRAAADAVPDVPQEPTALFAWGRLRVIEKLGEGGFGEVWRAWDPALRREVALKLRRAGEGAATARWLREAQALARVQHPHVVTVYGADVHDERAGLWMDLVRGRTLEQILRAVGPLGAREAATIGLDLCAALASVHAAGLVHGDVKTGNVMRYGTPQTAEGAGRVVLMDFGSADDHGAVGKIGSPSAGTPLYAAPELLNDGAPSIASDLYALGVVLYRLVTDRFPVDAKSLEELRGKHTRGEIVPLRERRPDLPIAFVQVVERALERDPARRFASAAEMERALAGAAGTTTHAPAPRGSRRAGLAAGVAIGGALIGMVWAASHWLLPALRPHFALTQPPDGVLNDARATLYGARGYAGFGACVCAPGDVDGDGLQDVVVSAPGEDSGRGAATLFFGLPDGTLGRPMPLTHAGDLVNYGRIVSALGDINGDGHPDFAVGAPADVAAGRGAGDVLLHFGGPHPHAEPNRVLHGLRDNQDFGYAIAAGDLDGDGVNDLVVGAPLDDAAGHPTGRVYIYKGGPAMSDAPMRELSTGEPDSQFGFAVADIGDFNGDGYHDLAVGAHWDSSDGRLAGRVFLYWGGPRLHDQPDLVLDGPAPGAWFGTTVHGAGDLNGDGFADLVASASLGDGYAPESGVAYVYFGGRDPATRPALTLRGAGTFGRYGERMASADVNGDGIADLLLASPSLDLRSNESGAVFVFLGGPHLSDQPNLEVTGAGASGGFGWGLAALPAPMAGGFADVVIGAPGTGMNGPRSGAMSLVSFARYALMHPAAGEHWTAGHPATISWLGSEPARIEVAWNDATTYDVGLPHAGGDARNTATITVPADAHSARLRIAPAAAAKKGAVLAPRIEVSGVSARR